MGGEKTKNPPMILPEDFVNFITYQIFYLNRFIEPFI